MGRYFYTFQTSYQGLRGIGSPEEHLHVSLRLGKSESCSCNKIRNFPHLTDPGRTSDKYKNSLSFSPQGCDAAAFLLSPLLKVRGEPFHEVIANTLNLAQNGLTVL